MTTKRILFNKSDGSGVAVDTPTPRKVRELIDGGMTEAEALDHIAQKTMANRPDLDADYSITEASELPSRRFRSAWKRDANKKPVVDMTKANEVLATETKFEADKRVAEVAPPEKINQMLARAARLNAEVGIKGRPLTAGEHTEVDQLIAVDNYTNAVRKEAERFIRDDLPTLTEDEKLNFNPATNPKLKWPTL